MLFSVSLIMSSVVLGNPELWGRRQQLPEGWHPESVMNFGTPGDAVRDTQPVSFCIVKCLQMEKHAQKSLK